MCSFCTIAYVSIIFPKIIHGPKTTAAAASTCCFCTADYVSIIFSTQRTEQKLHIIIPAQSGGASYNWTKTTMRAESTAKTAAAIARDKRYRKKSITVRPIESRETTKVAEKKAKSVAAALKKYEANAMKKIRETEKKVKSAAAESGRRYRDRQKKERKTALAKAKTAANSKL